MHLKMTAFTLTAALIGVLILMSVRGAAADAMTLSVDGSVSGAEKKKVLPFETEFIFSAGYRRDELDWNIAGDINGNNPNVLSELSWEDLEITQLRLLNKTMVPNRFYLRASVAYGWIFDGTVQDSDYAGNNRTFEFSRSNNSSDDGDVRDASVAIGYPIRIGGEVSWTIIPLAGYSYHEQNLRMTDGFQTVSIPVVTPSVVIVPPPLGPFPGLDSTYETRWKGPWIGLDLNFKVDEIKAWAHRIETYVSFEYHWADYNAEAHWNLRDDFAHPKSFEHDADGVGVVLTAGFNVVLTPRWRLNINYDYQDWSTDDGTDTTFFSDGRIAKTRLNEVNWTSQAISLGLIWQF